MFWLWLQLGNQTQNHKVLFYKCRVCRKQSKQRIGSLFSLLPTDMDGSKSPACTMQVSFVCQRCSQPLKLDTSFKVLDRVTIQELTGKEVVKKAMWGTGG